MVSPVDMTGEQLLEHVKTIQFSDGWKCLCEIVNRRIEHSRDLLEVSQAQEATIRLQTKIKTLRGILTFDIK